MVSPIRGKVLLVLTMLSGMTAAAQSNAETTGANATHDPSRIVESDGRFYFCSTGGACASSADGLAWTATGLRIQVPSWSTTYAPSGNQGVWAPDIIYFGGTYYIYYSFCGVPAANAPCVIGLYTTPTLDAKSAAFALHDAGMVVNNPTNTTDYQFSTIDPGPIIDTAGDLWLAWGSGYGKDQTKTQLWVTRLDDTGLPLASDTAYQPPKNPGHPLQPGRKEGGYLHYHNGYYYLFYNEGSCCSGTSSDYTIYVARSSSVTGPFAGDKIFYASSGNIHGPGHMGIYSACGAERFTYHYYPTSQSILGENELSWGGDDWPVAGPPSTTPLTPCGDQGGAGGQGGTPGSGGVAASGAPNSSGAPNGGAGAGGTGTDRAGAPNKGGRGGVPGIGGLDGASGGSVSEGGHGGTASGLAGSFTGGSGTTAVAAGGAAGAQGGNGNAAGRITIGGMPGDAASPSADGTSQTGEGCACSVPRRPRLEQMAAAWLGGAFGLGGLWRRRRRRAGSAR